MSEIGDAILASQDRQQEDCAEWGQEFCIQELSADDVEWLDKADVHEVKKLAMIVVRGAIDQNGERLFKDQNAQGLSSRKSAGSLQRVADQILDLSGLSEKAPEAQAKNSATTPKPECGTDLASGSESPTSPD